MRFRPALVTSVDVRRDEDWLDGGFAASPMEVLQVQGVVPGLASMRSLVRGLPDLELDREDGGPRDEHRVDSTPQPRNCELQVQPAIQAPQRRSQNRELCLPSVALKRGHLEGARSRQPAKDGVEVKREELVYGRVKPCARSGS